MSSFDRVGTSIIRAALSCSLLPIPISTAPTNTSPITPHSHQFDPAFAPIQIQIEIAAAQQMPSQPSVFKTNPARRYLSFSSPATTSTQSVIMASDRLEWLLKHANFVPQLVHQFLRHFGRRTFQHLGLLRLLRYIEALDLLKVLCERAFHLGPGNFP